MLPAVASNAFLGKDTRRGLTPSVSPPSFLQL